MSILTQCDACAYIRILGDTIAHSPFDDLPTMKANILQSPSKFSPQTAEGLINIVEFVFPRYQQHEATKAAEAANEAKMAAAARRAVPNVTVLPQPTVIPAARAAVTGRARRVMPREALPQGVPPRGQGGLLRGGQLPGASAAVRGTPSRGVSNPVRGASSRGRSSHGASPAQGVAGATATPQSWASGTQKAAETTRGVIGVGERGKANDGSKKGKGKAWGA